MEFTVSQLILVSLAFLIFFGVAECVLDCIHLSDKQALLVQETDIDGREAL